MKATLIMIMMLLVVTTAFTETTLQKAVTPESWITQKAMKWGFVGAFAGSQAISGITEGYSFGGRGIAGEDTYHAFRTGRDLGWYATGYLAFANLQNPHQSGWGKARRLLGAALIGRDAFEWSYRAQRYKNPFDYTADHNRHSLVYFGWRSGGLTTLYIGTGPATGPLVDMLFLASGVWLLGWE